MSEKGRTVYLKDYKPSSHLIDQVELFVDLHEDHALVRSRLHLRRNPASTGGPDLELVGESLVLEQLSIDGVIQDAGAYELCDTSLKLPALPEACVVETISKIEPQKNTALSGLYRSKGLFCTQCEAEGFRRITWYLDRPDVLARFKVAIEADSERYPVLLANGNPVDSGEAREARHYAVWEDPFPKPAYLFAMVAGNLKHIRDTFTTQSGRTVDLRIYTDPHNVHKCDFAMESLKKSMAWDEQRFGREYDLDIFMIVAVDDFNMGAMENKGLNLFNSSLVLALPEATTDMVFGRIEGVVAHEYFHNWTGNRITCRDWFQLTLKEGLTVFRDQEFSSDMGSRDMQRIDDVQTLRLRQFTEDASPMAHPIQPDYYQKIDNFYTATVYEKGAEVIRMMLTLLGEAAFRKGMDRYFEKHDGQAVTTVDFVKALEEGSGVDLTQIRRWYHQFGTPCITVNENWEPEAGVLELQMRQEHRGWTESADRGPLHVPIRVGLLSSTGEELPVQLEGGQLLRHPGLLELCDTEASFRLTGLSERPRLSINRGFTAPVKLERKTSREDLAFLLAHDTDSFARWEAGQELYRSCLLEAVNGWSPGSDVKIAPDLMNAWRSVLLDRSADPGFLASCLSLPGFATLSQYMDVIQVDALREVGRAYRKALVANFSAELKDTLAWLDTQLAGPYEWTPRMSGLRSMRGAVISALAEAASPEFCADLETRCKQANNMTDTMTMIGSLIDTHSAERERVLEAFASRWMEDDVVMNGWFAIQATSLRPDTLEQIKALMEHKAFDLRNPNKVRSLIGVLGTSNPYRFHEKDGSAYSFYTDQLLKVDALNPQMGAGLSRALISWRRFDKERGLLMKQELERIAAHKGLSSNAYEIVSRSLE